MKISCNLPYIDILKIEKVRLELMSEFDRICKKYKIQYFAGPELTKAILNPDRYPRPYVKYEFYLKSDDFVKFRKIVLDELDYIKYFINARQAAENKMISCICLCKNATQLKILDKQNAQRHTGISIIISPLQPVPNLVFAQNIIVTLSKWCFFWQKNSETFLKKQRGFIYKAIRQFYNCLNKVCLSYSKFLGRKEELLLDINSLTWNDKAIFYKKEWFIHSMDYSLFGKMISISDEYESMIKEYDSWTNEELILEFELPVKYHEKTVKKACKTLRRVQLIETELLLEADRVCRKHQINYSLLGGTLIGAIRHQGFIPWDDDVDIALERDDYQKLMEVLPNELDKDKYFLQTVDSDPCYCNTWGRLMRKGTIFAEDSQTKMAVEKGIRIDILPYDHRHKNDLTASVIQFLIARFKTIMWAEKGKVVSTNRYWRFFYRCLAVFPKKTAYRCILALCRYTKKHCLNRGYFINVNSFELTLGFYDLDFGEVIEMPFEGHRFMVFKNWSSYLFYFGDFMSFPDIGERKAHSPVLLDTGGLYSEY